LSLSILCMFNLPVCLSLDCLSVTLSNLSVCLLLCLICLFVFLSVCLSVCMPSLPVCVSVSVCLFVCLFVCLYAKPACLCFCQCLLLCLICLSVCLSVRYFVIPCYFLQQQHLKHFLWNEPITGKSHDLSTVQQIQHTQRNIFVR